MNNEFKMIDYKTAAGTTAEELDLAVMELLGQGYEPYGSPYLSDQSAVADERAFYQAMVLTNKPRVALREFAHQKNVPTELNVGIITGDDLPPADVTR